MKTGTMSPELLTRVTHPWEQALPSACHFSIAPIQRNGLSSSKRKSPPFGGRKKGKAQKNLAGRMWRQFGSGWFFCGAFFYFKNWSLFLFKGVGTSQMCAAKGGMQMGMLAYTDADNTMQHRAQPQHLWSFFSLLLYNYLIVKTNVRKWTNWV